MSMAVRRAVFVFLDDVLRSQHIFLVMLAKSVGIEHGLVVMIERGLCFRRGVGAGLEL